MAILILSFALGSLPTFLILMVAELGKATWPPIPKNKGLRDGICPYLLVSPADLKF